MPTRRGLHTWDTVHANKRNGNGFDEKVAVALEMVTSTKVHVPKHHTDQESPPMRENGMKPLPF